METNYYTSIHTNISYERTVKTSGRQEKKLNGKDVVGPISGIYWLICVAFFFQLYFSFVN